MGKRKAEPKREIIDNGDGSRIVKTGIYFRTIEAPAAPIVSTLSEAERDYLKKLAQARKKHPNDPDAAREAALKRLSPAHGKAMQQSWKAAAAAAKQWVDDCNAQPGRTFDAARERCRKTLANHGIQFAGPLPDFHWQDGTQSICPDPADLLIFDEVRDACEVLKQIHGLIATIQTQRAFLAGLAFQRMMTRPFEDYAFTGRQLLKSGAEGGRKRRRFKTEDKKVAVKSERDQLVEAGHTMNDACGILAKKYGVSARSLKPDRLR